MSSPALSEEGSSTSASSSSSNSVSCRRRPQQQQQQQEVPASAASAVLLAAMDTDGLITQVDVVQARVRDMLERHRCEVQLLKREIFMARQRKTSNGHHNGLVAVAQHPMGHHQAGGPQDHGVGAEGEDLVGMARNGSTTSETPSWENVDEKEARPTLWIPDHASTACMK